MSDAPTPTLAERMRLHPCCSSGSELETHAKALEALDNDTPVSTILGTWARARLFWCALTGEVLI